MKFCKLFMALGLVFSLSSCATTTKSNINNATNQTTGAIINSITGDINQDLNG